jgi:hypothetical protein
VNSVPVTDKITPEGAAFMKELQELAQLEVFVGFQRGKKTTSQVDMIDVAAFNELGTSRAPSRPFIRQTFDNHTEEIAQAQQAAVDHVLGGGTAKQAASNVGDHVSGLMSSELENGPWVPNAKSTARRKKSEQPLVDTGAMSQSIHPVIRKKGKDGG